jgi:hypothetical protein
VKRKEKGFKSRKEGGVRRSFEKEGVVERKRREEWRLSKEVEWLKRSKGVRKRK